MSVPNHQPGCTTTLWQTRCRDCSAIVYFFSCSCGSRVFFDSPGYPWPLHTDRCPQYLVRQCRANGASTEGIVQLLHGEAEARGVEVPHSLIAELRREARPAGAHPLFVELEPDSERDFLGVVMSVDRNINVPRRFGLPQNHLARSLLGPLGRTPHSEIRMREEMADKHGITAEVRALMPSGEVEKVGLRVGHHVIARIEPYAPPGRDPVWIVTEVMVRR